MQYNIDFSEIKRRTPFFSRRAPKERGGEENIM
jgi:hypothetical protein